ncbi:MAG TPA: portal protein, partial [Methylococcales bacterium]
MPTDTKAEQIIADFELEQSRQSNIRSLWQDTADYIYPYIDVTKTSTPGQVRSDRVYDVTPMLDMQDMVAGLKQILIPSGQLFFAAKLQKEEEKNDDAGRYLSMLTERTHEELFASNFITEFDEILRSMIVFGPGSIYSEWNKKTGLNFRASVVGSFCLIEDSTKNV